MKKIFIGAVALLAVVSCKNALDIFNADMSFQIFGGGAYLPLCSTKEITLSEALGENGLKVDPETGIYYLEAGQSLDISKQIPSYEGLTASVPDQNVVRDTSIAVNWASFLSQSEAAQTPAAPTPNVVPDKLEIQYKEHVFEWTFDLSDDFTDHAKINDVVFVKSPSGNVGYTFKLANCSVCTKVDIEYELIFPELFVFDDPRVQGGVFKDSFTISQGQTYTLGSKLNLSGLHFAPGQEPGKHISGLIKGQCKCVLYLDKSKVDTKTKNVSFGYASTTHVDQVTVASLTGHDINLDLAQKVSTKVAIDGIPDVFAEDAVLDLENQYIALTTSGNFSLPLTVNASLIPYRGNQMAPDEALVAKLDVPAAPNGTTAVNQFWIVDKDFGLSAPEGVALIPVTKGTFDAFFKKIPNNVQVELDGGVYTPDTYTILPSEHPKFDVDAYVRIPLSFGTDFYATKTFPQITIAPEQRTAISNILRNNIVGIVGNISSSIPLEFELKINLIDVNGKRIEDAAKTKIRAYNPADGEVTVTDLNLLLSKLDADSAELASLELVFVIRHSNETNGPASVHSSSHLQATLALALPEGVSVNFPSQNK